MTYRHRRPGVFRGRTQVIAAILLALLPVVVVMQVVWMSRNQDALRPLLLQFQVDRFTCDHCQGTGVVRDKEHPEQIHLCPICFGVGGHQVRKWGPGEAMCPACAGMGRMIDPESGEARFCRRCNGRGLIRAER